MNLVSSWFSVLYKPRKWVSSVGCVNDPPVQEMAQIPWSPSCFSVSSQHNFLARFSFWLHSHIKVAGTGLETQHSSFTRKEGKTHGLSVRTALSDLVLHDARTTAYAPKPGLENMA